MRIIIQILIVGRYFVGTVPTSRLKDFIFYYDPLFDKEYGMQLLFHECTYIYLQLGTSVYHPEFL